MVPCRTTSPTRKDLEPIFGTRNRTSEIFNRKRGLSIEIIRNLHDRRGISVDVLIRPTRHDEAT
jgi:HTH-type transcriptional regulator/antitoxin HigA